MPIRLVAFDLDGTLIRGPSSTDEPCRQLVRYVGADRSEDLAGIEHYPEGNIAAVGRAILRP